MHKMHPFQAREIDIYPTLYRNHGLSQHKTCSHLIFPVGTVSRSIFQCFLYVDSTKFNTFFDLFFIFGLMFSTVEKRRGYKKPYNLSFFSFSLPWNDYPWETRLEKFLFHSLTGKGSSSFVR